VSSIEEMSLFPFDTAKVRRFLQQAMNIVAFLLKKGLSVDVNQAGCVRTHPNCVR
jgi:hypothetical protein